MKKEKKKLKIIHDEHDFRKKPKNYVREKTWSSTDTLWNIYAELKQY